MNYLEITLGPVIISHDALPIIQTWTRYQKQERYHHFILTPALTHVMATYRMMYGTIFQAQKKQRLEVNETNVQTMATQAAEHKDVEGDVIMEPVDAVVDAVVDETKQAEVSIVMVLTQVDALTNRDKAVDMNASL